jgi:hypothetical protein
MLINMKNIIRKFNVTWLIIVSICLTSIWSCGSAPNIKLVENSDNLGLVYIYRPKKFYYRSSDIVVYANGFKIDILKNGGYFHYFTKPGRVQFSARTEITSIVTLDVQPGQTHYIKAAMTKGELVARPNLTIMASEIGADELKTCWKKKTPEKKIKLTDSKPVNGPEA